MTNPPVALVGAGPGDPELLTLRAEALLGLAGTVVVDAGLEALALLFTRDAEVVVVPASDPAVGALLAAAVAPAGPVVRLYRGDPWLHPAYGPERAALDETGVPAEVVAGVAVEVAVPARAGVPVHVRHLAVACTFGPSSALPAASEPSRTLVATGEDAARMVRDMAAAGGGGRPAALVPIADRAVAWRGSLAGAAAPAAALSGPALLVVGAVCGVPSSPVGGEDGARGPRPGAGPLRQERVEGR